jgi:hypothetical protein
MTSILAVAKPNTCFFLDVIDQLFFLQVEYSCDRIGTIGSRQVVWDISKYFPPLGIADKR